MKVLLASDLNPETVNGVIVSVMMLKRELEKLGCEVRLLTLSPSMHSKVENHIYWIGSLPLKIYPDIRMSLDIYHRYINELIDWKPDIIHSQCEFFTYSFVQRIAHHCGCPIIHTYHTQYEYYTKYVLPGNWNRMLAKMMQMRLESSDVIIAPSEKTRSYLLGENIARDVRVIPTGVDLTRMAPSATSEELASLKASIGVPEDWQLYGNIGRIAQEKNLPEVLLAHRAIREHHSNVGLLLVGDGAAMEETVQLTKKWEIADSVFFPGMVSPDEVGKYYQLLSFFVSASVSETQGLTYIEALSNGRPVLARRDKALDGVIEEGVNGYLFDTTEECTAHIETLLCDESQLHQLQEGALASRERFRPERFGQKVYALYGEVLHRGNQPASETTKWAARFKRTAMSRAEESDSGVFLNEVRMMLRRMAFDEARVRRQRPKSRGFAAERNPISSRVKAARRKRGMHER